MTNYNFISYLHKYTKSILLFSVLFCILNFQKSLSFLSFFEIATPNIIAITLYLLIISFSINPSNMILFVLGLVHDIMTGDNIGTTSIFLLLFKFVTESLFLNRTVKKSDEWISFTIIFLLSFVTVLLLNMVINFSIPQFGPIFFHIGITLILFPIINVSKNFFNFVTKLIKS